MDKDVIGLFSSPAPLGLKEEDIMCPTGTLGVPELGTKFLLGMLSETKPKTFAELLKISPIDGYLANGHIAEHYQRYKSAELNYKSAIAVGQSKTAYQKLADLYKNKMQQPQKATILMAEYQRTL